MQQVSAALIRRQERDADLLPVAALLTFQSFTNLGESKIFAQMLAQFHQAQASVMTALATVSTVVIRVVDMSQRVAFEPRVFHLATIALRACGLLLYNSYSTGGEPVLYEFVY